MKFPSLIYKQVRNASRPMHDGQCYLRAMISWIVSGVSHGHKSNDQQDDDGSGSHGDLCSQTDADVKQLNTLETSVQL